MLKQTEYPEAPTPPSARNCHVKVCSNVNLDGVDNTNDGPDSARHNVKRTTGHTLQLAWYLTVCRVRGGRMPILLELFLPLYFLGRKSGAYVTMTSTLFMFILQKYYTISICLLLAGKAPVSMKIHVWCGSVYPKYMGQNQSVRRNYLDSLSLHCIQRSKPLLVIPLCFSQCVCPVFVRVCSLDAAIKHELVARCPCI